MIEKEQNDINNIDNYILVLVTVKIEGGCKVNVLKQDDIVFNLLENARDPEKIGLKGDDRLPVKLIFCDNSTQLNFDGDEFGLSSSLHYTLATPISDVYII